MRNAGKTGARRGTATRFRLIDPFHVLELLRTSIRRGVFPGHILIFLAVIYIVRWTIVCLCPLNHFAALAKRLFASSAYVISSEQKKQRLCQDVTTFMPSRMRFFERLACLLCGSTYR